MPTIPRYGPPKVDAPSVPGVRISGPSPEIPSLRGAEQAVRGIASTVEQFVAEEKRKADRVKVVEAHAKLVNKQDYILNAPENGALKSQGSNAFAVFRPSVDEYEKQADEISKTLTNDDQRAEFNEYRLELQNSLKGQLRDHISRETQKFGRQKSADLVTARREAAMKSDDPAVIEEHIKVIEKTYVAQGKDEGMPPEWASNLLNNERSAIYYSFIERMNDLGKSSLAGEYYKQHEEHILEGDRDKLRREIKTGDIRTQSLAEFDRIRAAGGDFKAQMAEAEKIKEAELRDSVESRLTEQFNIDKAIEAEDKSDALQRAWSTLESNGYDSIATSDLELIGGDNVARLKARAIQKSNGYAQETDPVKYVEFIGKSSQEIKNMSKADITDLVPFFSKQDYEQAVNIWRSVQEGKSKDYESQFSDSEMIRNLAVDLKYGDILRSDTPESLEKDEDKAEAFYNLTNMVNSAWRAAGADTDEKKEKVLNKLALKLAQEVTLKGQTFLGMDWANPDDVKRIIDLTPQEIETEAIDIPDSEIQRYLNVAKASGDVPQGTTLETFKRDYRGFINRSFIAEIK